MISLARSASSTIVLAMGEFGHTPFVNRTWAAITGHLLVARARRRHQGWQVIGSSDEEGANAGAAKYGRRLRHHLQSFRDRLDQGV
jgi:hypothetical protein